MDTGIDKGVRRYRSSRRNVLFVDEHPDLVELIYSTPATIRKAREIISDIDEDHVVVPMLDAIFERATKAADEKGAKYANTSLISHHEGTWFSQFEADQLTRTEDAYLKQTDGDLIHDTFRFLRAAARGAVFLARFVPAAFVAYELKYEPGPGHVLLDATADLSGMVALMDGMEELEVPTVDFSNLDIRLIDHPADYRSMRKVLSREKHAKPYAAWIEQIVLQNTKPGDDILVVYHKDLGPLGHNYIKGSEDPDDPWDPNGRKVNTLHWGIGVGSNHWKNKTKVFLFGEFFIPGRASIAQSLAYGGELPTSDLLSQNSGSVLQGNAAIIHEGHLLRWQKQLACRGAVRNIDPQGRCGPMTLYTSMNPERLLENLDRLFPGAKPPVLPVPANAKPSDKLAALLSDTDRSEMTSTEIQGLTGLQARKLGEALKSRKLKAIMDAHGWSFVSARGKGQQAKLVKSETPIRM